ncbi:hypothetical protein T440DRAFT_272368 [Plenodomus tracheiphilus IPT5]|uniref:Uncharacterized protein n=1 Tax=Plenodomus tracheiphilus IPT5 TaxID=1408161 RepID=A0A6A7BIJ8_9PLEO|nr:hypothetical protein T440DRAFT_272368 [Plenodomus tracheiphilus IPT5]
MQAVYLLLGQHCLTFDTQVLLFACKPKATDGYFDSVQYLRILCLNGYGSVPTLHSSRARYCSTPGSSVGTAQPRPHWDDLALLSRSWWRHVPTQYRYESWNPLDKGRMMVTNLDPQMSNCPRQMGEQHGPLMVIGFSAWTSRKTSQTQTIVDVSSHALQPRKKGDGWR